eukprot:14893590-Alexandrium_andersonii.AAC.1
MPDPHPGSLGGVQLGPGLGHFDARPGPIARIQRGPARAVRHLRGPGLRGPAPGIPPLEV